MTPRFQYGNQRQQQTQTPFNDFDPRWITDGPDFEMVKFCEKTGKAMANEGISSSQLRNIYGEILRINQKGYESLKEDFLLLKPKVAYNASRLSNMRQKKLFKAFVNKVFNPAHEKVNDNKTFKNFHRFFEAILAYHKSYDRR